MEAFPNSNTSDSTSDKDSVNSNAKNIKEMLEKVQFSAFGKSSTQNIYECAYIIYRECFGDPDKIDFAKKFSENFMLSNALKDNESLNALKDIAVSPLDAAALTDNLMQPTIGDFNRSDRECLQSQQRDMEPSSTSSMKLPDTSDAPPNAVYCHSENNNTDETKTLIQQDSLDSREPFSTCNTCGKHFFDSIHLTKHMACHARPRPFQCSVCDKTFSGSDNLQRHERIHTGSRPFQCNICTKAFPQSSSLRVHERFHTGFKPYKCQICDKSFSQGCNLRRHECIHTGSKPFQCNFCSQSFSSSSNLRRHERTHTGFKPFKCKYCSKAFCQSSHLRVHERTHTGFKPFSCKFCSKAFSDPSHLLRHERIHKG